MKNQDMPGFIRVSYQFYCQYYLERFQILFFVTVNTFLKSEGPEKNGGGADKKPHFPELHKPGNNKSNKKKSPGRTRPAFQPMKSPCLALNELKPGIEYKVVGQDGPVHMPTFKISVELDGNTFIGEGR